MSENLTTTEEPDDLPETFGVHGEGLPEKVFSLRQKLYRKAKRQPSFRFYASYDRVVQMAVLLLLEPIFEADFLDCSDGFRPGPQRPSGVGPDPAEPSAGAAAGV